MYKVFINDKEIRFSSKKDNLSSDSLELQNDLSAAEIVSSIQECKIPGIRIFYIRNEEPEKRFAIFISYFPVINAAGGIVRKNSAEKEILMIYRLGKWDLPKGKIDKGENQEQAALREVKEECGISKLKLESKITDTYHLYELKGVQVLKSTNWYLMSSDDNGPLTPQLDEGITDVKWVTEKDIYFLLPSTHASIADLLTGYILKS